MDVAFSNAEFRKDSAGYVFHNLFFREDLFAKIQIYMSTSLISATFKKKVFMIKSFNCHGFQAVVGESLKVKLALATTLCL